MCIGDIGNGYGNVDSCGMVMVVTVINTVCGDRNGDGGSNYSDVDGGCDCCVVTTVLLTFNGFLEGTLYEIPERNLKWIVNWSERSLYH